MYLNTLLDQGITLLTASRRLAHSLRLDYAQHAQGNGARVWRTPRVLPWSAWLRQQWLENRATLPPQAEQQPSRLLNPAQSRVLWDEIVGSSTAAEGLLNPSSAARAAARSWQRLHDYLIPIDQLTGAASIEAQTLHDWIEAFTHRCEILDAIDDARLADWAFHARLIPQERLAFAGFDLITPAMRRLVDLWREAGKIEEPAPATKAATRISVVAAPDADAEIEIAARWSRAQLELGVSRIGIVIADLQQRRNAVRRIFEDVFAPGSRAPAAPAASLPVVIAAPEPLAAWPLVDAAALCLQLAMVGTGGGARSTVAGRILRSAFIAGGETERDARAQADFRLRDEQRDRWDWFELERWAGITGCPQLQLAAREVSAVLRGGLPKASPSTWAERFHRLLRAAGWPGERTLSSIEHQTLIKFQAALAEFGALDAVLGALTFPHALARLKEILQDTPFEPEAEAAPITVIDAVTVAGMRFDAVWVAGLDATRLPPPASPDPLIPLTLQRNAAIPEATPEGTFNLANLQLQRLIASTGELVLSWPERDGDAQLQPSPLLADWPALRPQDMAQASTRSLRQTLFDARPTLLTTLDEYAPALAAERTSGGAMILELQSRCPFRSQAELRLHAKQMQQVSLGIEPRDRGTLLHRVLAGIWSELKGQRALLATDDATLGERIRAIATRHAAQMLRPATPSRGRLTALEIDSVVHQVLVLMAIERTRAPFVVRMAEQDERFEIGGLQIRLQPDRVDELSDGGQLLLDYKLGDSHTQRQWLDAWPGRPRRPQLPLYALAHAKAVSGLAFVVLAPRTVEFRGWSRDPSVAPGILAYPPRKPRVNEPPDWNALMQHWQSVLAQLAGDYLAGSSRVDPLPQECQMCHLSTFCRVHERGRGDGDDVSDGGDE